MIDLKQLERDCIAIHSAIHSDRKSVTLSMDIPGIPSMSMLPILIAPNGCRYVEFHDIKFMEQNQKKFSDYARRAREGEKITWGIRDGSWILIDNKGVHIPDSMKSKSIVDMKQYGELEKKYSNP